jgi:hypothetical protein
MVAATSSAEGERSPVSTDTITSVTIKFYPSFTNKSVLCLDRIKGEVSFIVDTIYKLKDGKPLPVTMSLKEMEKHSKAEKFWKPDFIKSLESDPPRPPVFDGMDVFLEYFQNGEKRDIFLGNNRRKKADRILLNQLNYIERKTTDAALKAYLERLKRYL